MATLDQLHELFPGPTSDEEVIQKAAERFKINPAEIAHSVGYVGKMGSVTVSTGYQTMQQHAGSFADRIEEKAIGGAVMGVGVAVLLSVVAFVRWGLPRLPAAIGKSAVVGAGAVASSVEMIRLVGVHPSSRSHDAFYIQAIDELDESRCDKATWARALASSDGDNGRCRANYIKLRVSQLELSARESKPHEQVGILQKAVDSSRAASDSQLTKNRSEVAIPKVSPRTAPLADTSAFTPEQCESCLKAAGCRIVSQRQGMWEVIQPSGVTAFAYSLDVLKNLAATYGSPAGLWVRKRHDGAHAFRRSYYGEIAGVRTTSVKSSTGRCIDRTRHGPPCGTNLIKARFPRLVLHGAPGARWAAISRRPVD